MKENLKNKVSYHRTDEDIADICKALAEQRDSSMTVFLSREEVFKVLNYINDNKSILTGEHPLFDRFMEHHLEALRDEKNGLIKYNGIYINFDTKCVTTHEIWV